jgi:hypothetical protein
VHSLADYTIRIHNIAECRRLHHWNHFALAHASVSVLALALALLMRVRSWHPALTFRTVFRIWDMLARTMSYLRRRSYIRDPHPGLFATYLLVAVLPSKGELQRIPVYICGSICWCKPKARAF